MHRDFCKRAAVSLAASVMAFLFCVQPVCAAAAGPALGSCNEEAAQAEALDYDVLNQQLEACKVLGRSTTMETLDQQLAAGQIDQTAYELGKMYIRLAAANTTVASLPALDGIVSAMASQMATSDVEFSSLPVNNMMVDAGLSGYGYARGYGDFVSMASTSSNILSLIAKTVSQAADQGYLVPSCYASYQAFTRPDGTHKMIYMVIFTVTQA